MQVERIRLKGKFDKYLNKYSKVIPTAEWKDENIIIVHNGRVIGWIRNSEDIKEFEELPQQDRGNFLNGYFNFYMSMQD